MTNVCRLARYSSGLRVRTPLPAYRLTPDDRDRIAHHRKTCQACGGDPHRCMTGTGPKRFDRLKGCQAFTDTGQVRALPQPAQPWELKAA